MSILMSARKHLHLLRSLLIAPQENKLAKETEIEIIDARDLRKSIREPKEKNVCLRLLARTHSQHDSAEAGDE